MSRRIRLVVGVCLAVAAAGSVAGARAQTFYLGGEGGWSTLQDQTNKGKGLPSTRARFDSGFAAGARAGYEWGPWRFEEEYVYRSNDLNGLRAGGVTLPVVRGRLPAP